MGWLFLGTTQGRVLSRNSGTRVPVPGRGASFMVVNDSMRQLFDQGLESYTWLKAVLPWD